MLCYRLDKAGFDAILRARAGARSSRCRRSSARGRRPTMRRCRRSPPRRARARRRTARARARPPHPAASSRSDRARRAPRHARRATSSSRVSRNTLSSDRRRLEPDERQPRKRELGRGAVVPDLDDQQCRRGSGSAAPRSRIVRTASRPSSPPASASCGLVPVFGRQLLHRHAR